MANEFKDLFPEGEPRSERRSPEDDPLFGEPENRIPRTISEKEVKVLGVFEAADPTLGVGNTFIMFQDNMGRRVPIFVGKFEAYAVSMAIEREEVDRPMTYDLLKNIIERLGGTVERAVIDDLWQDIFYAKITVTRGSESQDIDCRPSDAVNIATRFRAPIYMAEQVIEAIEQKL